MEGAALITALRRTDSASRACSAALTRGAEFKVYEEATATAKLQPTTDRRRAEHVDAIGLEHDGFDQALADLEACEDPSGSFGMVRDPAERRQLSTLLFDRRRRRSRLRPGAPPTMTT